MNRLIITLVSILLVQPVSAETWVRGAVLLHDFDGEVTIGELGEDPKLANEQALPLLLGGLLNCEASSGGRAFLSASNRTLLQFSGEGSFSIERFEQLLPTAGSWESSAKEAGQSRTIVNFRSGQLAIDGRAMGVTSQSLIETPLGKVTLRSALLLMELEYDQRSEIFNFTISCREGRVRYIDNNGESYTLRTGQRLSAVGARTAPSIEVAELTDQGRDLISAFRSEAVSFADAAKVLENYAERLQPIEQSAVSVDAVADKPTAENGRRPIVIEHAKRPKAVTPFRGEIPPPSAYQADIF